MKLGYNDYSKRCEIAFAEFKPLWKLDDPNWVAQRKQEWRDYAGDNGGHPNLKYAGRYYVYGDEPPSYIDGAGLYDRTIIKFDFGSRLAFTPFKTKEQVRLMWDLAVTELSADGEVHDKAFVGERESKLPNSVSRVKMITEALFSQDQFLKEYNGRCVTVSADGFLVIYAGISGLYKKENIEADYRCFSFDYFMLCVKYCDEHNSLDTPRSQKALPNMYKSLLSYDDHSLNKYKLELKQRLIAAAEADDAPQILKRALEVARAES